MRKHNRFLQGAGGVYTCASCKRQTRDTGNGEDGICRYCYELAGFENGVSDSGGKATEEGRQYIAECVKEAVKLYQAITAKGGQYAFWTDLGPAVMEKAGLTKPKKDDKPAPRQGGTAKKARSKRLTAEQIAVLVGALKAAKATDLLNVLSAATVIKYK